MKKATELLQKELADMLANFDISGLLNINAESVVNSGSVDREQIETDKDHRRGIAKCIFSIALERAAKQYQPVSDTYQKEYKNLNHFI